MAGGEGDVAGWVPVAGRQPDGEGEREESVDCRGYVTPTRHGEGTILSMSRRVSAPSDGDGASMGLPTGGQKSSWKSTTMRAGL